MDKYVEYIDKTQIIIEKIKNQGQADAEKAALVLSNALINGKKIFLFGTGHSHMLAEELFYRAGGLVQIQPILEPELMLHISASGSTLAEREAGVAEKLFKKYSLKSEDVIIIISNSGRNGAVVDMALLCKQNGIKTIALTNLEHTYSGESRHPSGKRLCEIANITLNNFGCVGDACLSVSGIEGEICPTSTVCGALILNGVVARAVEICAEKGFFPEHFASSNVDGGDEINNKLVEKYKKEIMHL